MNNGSIERLMSTYSFEKHDNCFYYMSELTNAFFEYDWKKGELNAYDLPGEEYIENLSTAFAECKGLILLAPYNASSFYAFNVHSKQLIRINDVIEEKYTDACAKYVNAFSFDNYIVVVGYGIKEILIFECSDCVISLFRRIPIEYTDVFGTKYGISNDYIYVLSMDQTFMARLSLDDFSVTRIDLTAYIEPAESVVYYRGKDCFDIYSRNKTTTISIDDNGRIKIERIIPNLMRTISDSIYRDNDRTLLIDSLNGHLACIDDKGHTVGELFLNNDELCNKGRENESIIIFTKHISPRVYFQTRRDGCLRYFCFENLEFGKVALLNMEGEKQRIKHDIYKKYKSSLEEKKESLVLYENPFCSTEEFVGLLFE